MSLWTTGGKWAFANMDLVETLHFTFASCVILGVFLRPSALLFMEQEKHYICHKILEKIK